MLPPNPVGLICTPLCLERRGPGGDAHHRVLLEGIEAADVDQRVAGHGRSARTLELVVADERCCSGRSSEQQASPDDGRTQRQTHRPHQCFPFFFLHFFFAPQRPACFFLCFLHFFLCGVTGDVTVPQVGLAPIRRPLPERVRRRKVGCRRRRRPTHHCRRP